MNRRIITTLTLCILALAAGCDDAFDAPTALEPAAEVEPTWNDQQVGVIERMARNLAETLADPEFRESLYEEAAEEYTGDTEALYARLASRRVGGTSWEDRLNVDARPQDTESLHFYVYGVEYSNPGEAPLVAVGVEEEDVPTIKAFDSQGNEYELDAQAPPEQTVVVVGLNERLDENGQPRREFIENGQSTYVAADAPGGKGGGGRGGGGERGGSGEYRVSPHDEHIDAIYLVHDNEPWPKGDPEIMMQMNLARTPSNSFYSGSFRYVNDERIWYDQDRRLSFWYVNETNNSYGSAAEVMWWEEDNGDNPWEVEVEREVKGVTITFSFSLTDNDDKMGSVLVNFEDELGIVYDTGDIKWQHK